MTDTVFVVTCTTEDFGGTQTTVTQDVIAVYTSEDKAIAYCSLENIAENNRRATGKPATSHSRWGYDEVTLVPGDTPMTTDRGPARGETDHLAAIRQMLDGQWDAHLEITGDERQAIMRHAEALAKSLAEAEAQLAYDRARRHGGGGDVSDIENLLTETLEMLTRCGKSPADVRFVLSTDRSNAWAGEVIKPEWCTWDEFAARADISYDSGYGGSEIAETLKIVGDDWWLERGEYDGSEWWEYKTLPSQPESHNPELRLEEH